MKILLVDLFGATESTGINLGLGYLSAHLRAAGHQVSLLDTVNIRTGPVDERIKKAVGGYNPGLIGFPVYNITYKSAKEYIEKLRKYYSGKIVVGGPEILGLGAKSLEDMTGADFAVLGEGEVTMVELVDALERKNGKKELEGIAGLVWWDGDRLVENMARVNDKNVDKLLFPDYEIYGGQGMDVYPINTSRGCPYSCSFCFMPVKKWRARSPENIIEELKMAKEKYNISLFHIVDASFNMRPRRIVEFCDLLIEENIDLPWVIQGFRADRAPEDLLEKMYRAKCKRIWVGVESLDEEVYAQINKGETMEEIIESVKKMRKYDWEIFGYMIIGLPGDTLKKTVTSFEKAQKMGFDVLAYSTATHMTGTPLADWVLNNDDVNTLSDSYSMSSIGDKYDEVAYETPEFTAEERKLARKIISIKAGTYNDSSLSPNAHRIMKWLLVLRYDAKNVFRHIRRSIHYRLNYDKNVDKINLNRGLRLARVPDGTWGLGKYDRLQPIEDPIVIDLKDVASYTG
ncbi:B12-binding domain-containing radical SAM protein [Nitrospinae bacterium AH_259_B05_G02_I21]|nr:B12-binding domain-containing radical SAM protein [Nitrospinae bacterium AH_259_B05_G02_I21]MDA2931918.1 B12-binding domain-containing radical SAM protein [Nitrospinae bacterium AH-259-F20]